jgi:hypothetical protein
MAEIVSGHEILVQAWATVSQVVLAFSLLLVAIVQAIIYTRMRHDAVVRDAAAVFIKEFKILPEVDRDDQKAIRGWFFMPVWENTGNTQTIEMRSYVNWIPFDAGIPESFEFPDILADDIIYAKLLIGPKQTVMASRAQFSVGEIEAAIGGRKRLFIYGWVYRV